MLPRPSLSWCFPIRELSFEQKQQQHNTNTSGMVFVWRGILFGGLQQHEEQQHQQEQQLLKLVCMG